MRQSRRVADDAWHMREPRLHQPIDPMAAAGQKQLPAMTQHHHDIGRRSDHETHDQRPVLALLAAAQAHHLERGVDAGDVDRLCA